ncbi:MAG: redoxin family protein [Verrucomicrobiota bacterium]|jgi:thiol-disulfide isomerase/thioredoxin
MRKTIFSQIPALLTGVTLAIAAQSTNAALTIGDPAPKLQVTKWVQGEPVKEFKPGTVYIVEFWATWGVPCRVYVPDLNALYEKFKDKGVVVIGQDVLEPDDNAVTTFVKRMGDKMTYRVALDDKSQDKNGATATAWMTAANQIGIPTVFIVNQQGRIAWIGHPMDLDEKLLNDILANHYDPVRAAREYEQRQQKLQKLLDLSHKLNVSLNQNDWDGAEAAAAELEKLLPASELESLRVVRFKILLGRKDYAAAYKLGGSISDAQPDDAALQNELAWSIATRPGLEKRDLVLAEKMAGRANQATQGKEPAVLDTLARVQFMSGKTNEAVATEQKAVNLADGHLKEQLQQLLTSYQQGKLPE